MGRVRLFERSDIAKVASLHSVVFPATTRSLASLEFLFDEIFFRSPWKAEPASLVYEDNREIVGFLGILPRRMFVGDRAIWAAVSTQFMVKPGSRDTLAAVELLRRLFSGPHELAITDGANSSSRKLWEALGGATAHLYAIHWTRPLRPATYFIEALYQRRKYLQALLPGTRPLGKALDRLTSRWTPYRMPPRPRLLRTELDVEQLLACIARFQAESQFRVEYDEDSLDWILALTSEKSPFRRIRKVSLEARGRTIGFYVYYVRADMVAEVLQLGAARESSGPVLDDLFEDAWRHGAIAVSGRLAPSLMQDLSERHCSFRMGSPWTLVHSREPRLLNMVCRGDAALSRLDAEWWMPFAT